MSRVIAKTMYLLETKIKNIFHIPCPVVYTVTRKRTNDNFRLLIINSMIYHRKRITEEIMRLRDTKKFLLFPSETRYHPFIVLILIALMHAICMRSVRVYLRADTRLKNRPKEIKKEQSRSGGKLERAGNGNSGNKNLFEDKSRKVCSTEVPSKNVW